MRFLHSSFVLGLVASVFALGACSADSEDVDASGADVVGVKDLSVLEQELGLVKDKKDAHGKFSRGDAALAAGPCYKKTVLGTETGTFDFEARRYTNGAAVFGHKATGAMTGDARPILCVDLEKKGADGKVRTVSVDRFEIDSIVRYHLGREGLESADGKTLAFARGAFALGKTQLAKGAPSTMGHPTFRRHALKSITAGDAKIDASVAWLVFHYAWNSAVYDDTFSLKSDPVGKFVSVEKDGTVKYEKIEVRRNGDLVYIVGAGEGTDVTPDASCLRDGDGEYACEGTGRGNVDPKKSEAKLASSCSTCGMVPNESIRGIALGTKVERVREILGQPDATETWQGDADYFLDLVYGDTDFTAAGGKVVRITTQSAHVKTATGFGIGSPKSAVATAWPGLTCSAIEENPGVDDCSSPDDAKPYISLTVTQGKVTTISILSALEEDSVD